MTFYLFIIALLTGAEVLYLRLARRFQIVDKPNGRSSHIIPTVRGGGIIFWLAALGAFGYSQFRFPYFFLGLTLAAFVSFLDDIYTIPNRYRLGVQFASVGLLLYETGFWPGHWWVCLSALIIGVGIVNSYNFMDGINGITALYSLVTIGTLWYCHPQKAFLVDDELFSFVVIALLGFAYFNVRRQAVCFAGDVGSVSMAIIVLYILLQFVNHRQTYLPVLLLAVYGVDSVLTILHRLYLGQNIFQAHRLHLFQLLVHSLGWPHLAVAGLYAFVQLGVNIMVLAATDWSMAAQIVLAAAVLGTLTMSYWLVKMRLMRTEVLSLS